MLEFDVIRVPAEPGGKFVPKIRLEAKEGIGYAMRSKQVTHHLFIYISDHNFVTEIFFTFLNSTSCFDNFFCLSCKKCLLIIYLFRNVLLFLFFFFTYVLFRKGQDTLDKREAQYCHVLKC